MVLAYVLHDASAAHAHGAAAADGRWSASPDFTILAAAPLRELEGKVGAAGLALDASEFAVVFSSLASSDLERPAPPRRTAWMVSSASAFNAVISPRPILSVGAPPPSRTPF